MSGRPIIRTLRGLRSLSLPSFVLNDGEIREYVSLVVSGGNPTRRVSLRGGPIAHHFALLVLRWPSAQFTRNSPLAKVM